MRNYLGIPIPIWFLFMENKVSIRYKSIPQLFRRYSFLMFGSKGNILKKSPCDQTGIWAPENWNESRARYTLHQNPFNFSEFELLSISFSCEAINKFTIYLRIFSHKFEISIIFIAFFTDHLICKLFIEKLASFSSAS